MKRDVIVLMRQEKRSMAKVIILPSLVKKIKRLFSNTEANSILDLLETLETNPAKGKILTQIAGVVIKELKYKKFRFYFLTDGHILKFGTEDELATLLIKFVKLSDKSNQQKIIDNIKESLTILGFDIFK